MEGRTTVRTDKFLWAARLYKTRSMASEACRKGKILINGIEAKPSRIISEDDILVVKKLPVTYTYKVLKPAGNRVSAAIVPSLIEDLTPEEEKSKLLLRKSLIGGYREKGAGRPTKKERRSLDRLSDGINHL
jgi:ribosome-associated heat shock protein Hsp15